ncbi:MAG: protoporphyrinogen oxidase [Paracoccaceae bacterium]|nr:protoporphyrinogen oxidase [Paracoccaceae bacterium]
MTVLILFATIEGQTGKIARFAETEVRKAGRNAVLVDVADGTELVSFEGVGTVILAAPVHERRHPKEFEAFLADHRRELEERSTLLISVSLKAAFPEGMEDAGDYVTEMKMRTGFTPSAEALVAGAVRTASYDYFATEVVRQVVLRGRDHDPDAGEQEFTDWNALSREILGFLAREVTST